MRRIQLLGLLAAGALAFAACDPVGADVGGNNTNSNTNSNTNYNTNQNIPVPDAQVFDLVTLEGTVWSPGADQAAVIEANRFPIPGAAVIAYHAPPPDLPQGNYCNECVEIPAGTPNVIADAVDGTFQLALMPSRTYYLTVQKGEFRRVREITTPNLPNGTFTFDTGGLGQPRAVETTLPNRNDLAAGDNIPKIAMISAAYEDQRPMFEAMGFNYDTEVTEFGEWGGPSVSDLLNNMGTLNQYNLVIAPCGEEWPGGASAAANLRLFVKEGGALYVDDFNYDFVEQVWPEFLTFYSGSVCGDGTTPPSTVGTCNSWSSYDFAGNPGNDDFRDWLTLINNGSTAFTMELAYDYIYSMAPGEVGVSETGTGPNGEVYQEPFVWMYNADNSPAGPMAPATVSWPFYCGKVLYTVYHTESGSTGDELLLQEKIMMYLIMEVQTCSTGPIVD